MAELEKIVLDLVERPVEEEWFEFKENWYQSRELGEYISCLSNAAAFEGVEAGYLVWGVNNITHEIVGTDFTWRRDVKNEPLEHLYTTGGWTATLRCSPCTATVSKSSRTAP